MNTVRRQLRPDRIEEVSPAPPDPPAMTGGMHTPATASSRVTQLVDRACSSERGPPIVALEPSWRLGRACGLRPPLAMATCTQLQVQRAPVPRCPATPPPMRGGMTPVTPQAPSSDSMVQTFCDMGIPCSLACDAARQWPCDTNAAL